MRPEIKRKCGRPFVAVCNIDLKLVDDARQVTPEPKGERAVTVWDLEVRKVQSVHHIYQWSQSADRKHFMTAAAHGSGKLNSIDLGSSRFPSSVDQAENLHPDLVINKCGLATLSPMMRHNSSPRRSHEWCDANSLRRCTMPGAVSLAAIQVAAAKSTAPVAIRTKSVLSQRVAGR